MEKASVILDNWHLEIGEPELTDHQYHVLKQIINEVRKDTIEECARVAEIDCPKYNEMICDVSKKSILNLINELK